MAAQPLLPSGKPGHPVDESPSTLRKELTQQELDMVRRCLNAVESRGKQLEHRGLTKRNFICGVANSLFVAWSFGAIPEHFWMVYLFEVCVLFPIRWRNQVNAKPLAQHAYWLDFCWVCNFVSVFAMLALVIQSFFPARLVDADVRRHLFAACWGLGCGPLLLATGVVGNALIFHDADNVASVLIHLFPSLVLYTMGWQNQRVHDAWPSFFLLEYFPQMRPFGDIFACAATVYTVWLVCYTGWLLLHGMSLPTKGYDTIFHANMRGGMGRSIAKALGTPQDEFKDMAATNRFPVKMAVFYMIGHAVGVYVAILFSLLCFTSRYFHMGVCGFMTLVTIYNAASRYTFYMVSSYGIVLRKELGIPLNQ